MQVSLHCCNKSLLNVTPVVVVAQSTDASCLVYFSFRFPALLQSKPVCRMRIPVPAPALPRHHHPPARPDRRTHLVRRNGKAKSAWARPPSCFPPAPKGKKQNRQVISHAVMKWLWRLWTCWMLVMELAGSGEKKRIDWYDGEEWRR